MKRIGGLWSELVSFENLLLAWRKARKGKQRTDSAARFTFNLETELFTLQRELLSGEYRPGAYRLFTIYEGKPRLIAAAPFRDRVVHHALMNLIEQPIDRRFIHHSYACRKGKGVHAAVDRYQRWAIRYRYVLKMDVRRYFPSIDHQLLKEKIRGQIKDRRVLWLLDRIIDTAPPVEAGAPFPGDDLLTHLERPIGIPIGNLTSQFLANLYLDGFDHFVTEQLDVPGYLRYVDDWVTVDDDKGRLREARAAMEERLAADRLHAHPNKAQVVPTREGLNLLGYRVYPEMRRLLPGNRYRFERRLRAFVEGFAAGKLDWADLNPSVQSWIGHARHADTWALREKIFARAVFSRVAAADLVS